MNASPESERNEEPNQSALPTESLGYSADAVTKLQEELAAMPASVTSHVKKKAKPKRAKKSVEYGCNKCKLNKAGVEPASLCYNNLSKNKRTNPTERIIMIVMGSVDTSNVMLNVEAAKLIKEWTDKYITAPKVYITSAIKCSSAADPSKNSIRCCQERLAEELLHVDPDVIICMGKHAAIPFNVEGKATELYNRVFTLAPVPVRDQNNPDSPVRHTRECKIIITYPVKKFMEDITVRSSVQSAFRQAERFSKNAEVKMPDKYYLIESPEEFKGWVNRHLWDTRLNTRVHAFDIETNGREIHPKTEFDRQHPPKLRCISFSWGPDMAICVPYEDNPEEYHPILKRFMESNIKFTGHNVSFDIFFLAIVNDIYVKAIVGDTMFMASLLNPGRGKYGYGLKPLSAEWTDLGGYETDMKSTPDILDEDGNKLVTKWESVEMDVMAPYNCADADATLQLYHIFLKYIIEHNMFPAHWVMSNALFPIGEMEHNGFLVNVEWVNESRKKLEEHLATFNANLTRLYGKEDDWNSADRIGHILYTELGYEIPEESRAVGKDGKEKIPTDDATLAIINTEFTQELRKYRRASKLLSTYFNGYVMNRGLDDKLRADFVLYGTTTGRLSSSGDANLQNIPSGMAKTEPGYAELHDFKLKKAFIPSKPGWIIVNADQSQLELRIAGALSKESRFINSYKNKIDMHSKNANVSFTLNIDSTKWENEALAQGMLKGSEAYDIYVERELCKYIKHTFPEERQAAKTVSFGILYGMSKWGLAKDLNNKGRDTGSSRVWTPEECGVLIARFKKGYPDLTRWQEQLIITARKTGYTYTAFGRARPLPGILSRDFKTRLEAENQAINTPVQSAGSDFMMTGVINMRQRLDPARYKFLATVHDSIVCEVEESYLDEFVQISKQCLEKPELNGVLIPLCNVMPFVAEFEVGYSYGTLEEYSVK